MIHDNQFNLTSNQIPQKLTPPVLIGDFKVMHRPGQTFERTKARLTRLELKVQQTPHFLFARVPETQKIILVHQLAQAELDNNIGQYLMQELGPYGFMATDKAFGAALVGVVNSINPKDPASVWGVFSLNTLERLRELLDNPSKSVGTQDFITPFATIYQYLFDHKVGTSLLDVGCACAFWPLLVAEREQGKYKRIVGADNRQDAINLSGNMATLANITNVEFIKSDLLTSEFSEIGTFDTVTAIHLLEHIPEEQLSYAFSNLLKVTKKRLLIAVPYELQAEVAYGHEQTFSCEKLERWGQWCVQQMGGKGKSFCEDVMGGILTIERA